jgi:hypothetical protein
MLFVVWIKILQPSGWIGFRWLGGAGSKENGFWLARTMSSNIIIFSMKYEVAKRRFG